MHTEVCCEVIRQLQCIIPLRTVSPHSPHTLPAFRSPLISSGSLARRVQLVQDDYHITEDVSVGQVKTDEDRLVIKFMKY